MAFVAVAQHDRDTVCADGAAGEGAQDGDHRIQGPRAGQGFHGLGSYGPAGRERLLSRMVFPAICSIHRVTSEVEGNRTISSIRRAGEMEICQ
ncbi:hypothetical protein [Sphingobium yanoikuyae]|uniref:hypothetical protein n=1 Tax=Sphingobium yanoikuyae TaxID=13690 RepID=UPI003F68D5EE